MCILRNEVDEAAVISKVAAVYGKAGVLIRTAAIGIAAVPVGIGEGAAHDPVIGNLAVIAELVVVVLVLDALLTVLRLAACHTSPDALIAFARAYFTETFIHVIVFLTPGHEGKVCHAADRLVGCIHELRELFDATICIHRSTETTADHACIGFNSRSGGLRSITVAAGDHIRQCLSLRGIRSDLVCNIPISFDRQTSCLTGSCLNLILKAVGCHSTICAFQRFSRNISRFTVFGFQIQRTCCFQISHCHRCPIDIDRSPRFYSRIAYIFSFCGIPFIDRPLAAGKVHIGIVIDIIDTTGRRHVPRTAKVHSNIL